MAINIGTTGTAGRFIGGGAGVYRNTALKLFIDPYRYDCFTAESDSSMEDLSGWGNNLTCVNGATDFSNGYWYMDGTNDFAYRTDDSDFDYSTTTDFSVQLWYRNLGGGDFGLIGKGQFGSSGWYIWYSDDAGKLYLAAGGSSTFIQESSETWDSGWINLAVVVDRSTDVKIYKNGVLVQDTNSSSTSTSISTNRYLIIGGTQTSNSTSTVSNDFNGFFGPILIYSGLVLDGDEVRQNFNVHRGIFGV